MHSCPRHRADECGIAFATRGRQTGATRKSPGPETRVSAAAQHVHHAGGAQCCARSCPAHATPTTPSWPRCTPCISRVRQRRWAMTVFPARPRRRLPALLRQPALDRNPAQASPDRADARLARAGPPHRGRVHRPVRRGVRRLHRRAARESVSRSRRARHRAGTLGLFRHLGRLRRVDARTAPDRRGAGPSVAQRRPHRGHTPRPWHRQRLVALAQRGGGPPRPVWRRSRGAHDGRGLRCARAGNGLARTAR